MLIYILLIITIIVSCLTCIITVMLEKKEMQIESSSEEQTKTSINLLSKTIDITKTIEILDISDDDSSEEYSQEPVIIAVLDEDAQTSK